MTRLVVGLGNPGPEYDGTRHNVGFAIVDRLARHEGLLFHSSRSLEGYGGPRAARVARSHTPDALLVKPQTFMNRSGDVVAPLMKWAGCDLADDALEFGAQLLVVYDDMDLPLGKLRVRPGGGAGGHNGMRSIIDRLGTEAFARLRVGIGRPRTDAARHVLEGFSPDEQPEIDIATAESVEMILDWLLHGDIQQSMTRFHSRWSQGS